MAMPVILIDMWDTERTWLHVYTHFWTETILSLGEESKSVSTSSWSAFLIHPYFRPYFRNIRCWKTWQLIEMFDAFFFPSSVRSDHNPLVLLRRRKWLRAFPWLSIMESIKKISQSALHTHNGCLMKVSLYCRDCKHCPCQIENGNWWGDMDGRKSHVGRQLIIYLKWLNNVSHKN